MNGSNLNQLYRVYQLRVVKFCARLKVSPLMSFIIYVKLFVLFLLDPPQVSFMRLDSNIESKSSN